MKYKENDEELFDVLYKYVANKDVIENINKSVVRIIDIKKKYKINDDFSCFDNLNINTSNFLINDLNKSFDL